jgi:predicted Holliday junction resolvase-like endonuclease
MADVNIPQNIFWLIIVVIAVITIIIIVMQWRRVRESQSNVEFLQKQAELKKIELVEKDLEAKRMMENVLPLPQEQQEKLAQIRGETSKLMHKAGFMHSEINGQNTKNSKNS